MNKKNIFLALAIAALPGAPGAALAAEGDRLTGSVGLDYTTGDYGQSDDTDMLAIAFAAKYETGRWTFRGSVPYLSVTGPANVVASDTGGLQITPGAAPKRTDTGPGDLVLGASYLALYGADAPFLLDVGGKVKLATADEGKGLGTGENDYSVQAEAFKPYGAFTPFATLGYRWYGDPPGINLRNVLYGSLGSTYRMPEGITVGAAYDFRDRLVAGGGRLSEVSVFATRGLAQQWRLQVYAVAGLSDGSPDFGGGVVLSHSF
ncbi:MAG TPA: hypothetical protein VFZ81_05785 [Burkholderiales bacterium]